MKLPSLMALILTFGVVSIASAADTAELPSDCQVLGVWESSPPWFESEVTICAEADGTHWIQHELDDGSTRVSQLDSTDENRFHVPEGPNYHYELLPDGRLELGAGLVTYQADPIR